MNVTRPGSERRLRSSWAARPIRTSSREVRRTRASSSEIRSPDNALSRTPATSRSACTSTAIGSGYLLELDEAKLRHGVQLTRQVGQLEEPHGALALARAEVVSQLLEVPGEEAGRPPVLVGGPPRELLRLRPGERQRAQVRTLEVLEPLV